MNRPRILFLCTGNSCRSHMAEGWLRHLRGDRFESFSAGFVHPQAVGAMSEAGVDISGHRSKPLDESAGQTFDLLVTVTRKYSAEPQTIVTERLAPATRNARCEP